MPAISVIIPVYNTGNFLTETLNSVIGQDVDDMEVICVNDGSTDDSLQILNNFATRSTRIKVYSQSNQGQSVARNTALEHANGRYIYFMDSDDVLKEGCLKKCLEYIETHNYDFIFFDGETFCEDGVPHLAWNYQRTSIYEEGKAYMGDELMHSLLDNCTHRAVPWLLFIRHDVIRRLNLSFYPGIIHEDELFTTLLTIQSHNIGCLKETLVRHRIRGNSTMTTHYSRRNVDCYLIVVDELMKWAEKHTTKLSLIRKYARYTLDKVFYTAHVLPFKQKISLTKLMIRKKYINFVSMKNWARFIIKQ